MTDRDRTGAGTGGTATQSPSAAAARAMDPAMLDAERTADAPEAVNREQDDAPAQAQSVAEDALARATAVLGADEGEAGGDRAPDGAYEDGHSEPDLVETMDAMVTSGRIDTGAFAGERDDDGEADTLGDAGREPGERR